MTKTSADVITEALAWCGSLNTASLPSGDRVTFGKSLLQGLVDELVSVQGATIAWTIETIPDGLFLPMSRLLAHDLAARFGGEVMETRARAISRVRAVLFPNDLPLRGDADEDGTVDEAEEAANKRAAYY